MASFTDQVTQFNPYVSQLPVEAMVKVGMHKQAQYDEGVKRIQGQIDNVAGMEIAKGSDKSYLESKLNQLTSKLTMVAAGDFSNQQLVNSVGGMIGNVSKDENIQNAVSSTVAYKKGIADMNDANKKGTIGVSNAFKFNTKAGEWLNNSEVGQKFNTSYTQHTDVNKVILDAISKIHSNADFKDIGNVINADGTIDTRKISTTLTRQGYEAVTEGQIRTVVNTVLGPKELNQLQLDGEYNLQGYDEAALSRVAKVEYDKNIKNNISQLEQASKDLLITTDTNKQTQLNEMISSYKRKLGYDGEKGSLDESYEHTVASITKDPNSARGLIYTKNYIDQIANGFKWTHAKTEISANEIYFKTKNLELNYIQRNDKVKDDAIKNKISQGHLDIAISAEQRALAENGPKPPLFVGGGDAVTDNIESYKNFNNAVSKLDGDNTQILEDIARSKTSINIKVNPKDIREAIKNGKFQPGTDAERQWLHEYKKNESTIATHRAMLSEFDNQSAKEITGGATQKQTIDASLSNIPALVFKNSGETFTAKEVFDYMSKERTVSTPVGLGVYTTSLVTDNGDLTPRERLLKSKLGTREVGTNAKMGKTGNAFLDSYLEKLSPTVNGNKEFTSQINILTAKKLAPYSGVFKTESAAVVHKDNNDKDKFISTLTNIIKADIDQKVGGPQYNPTNALGLLTKTAAENLEQQVVRKGDDYWIKLTNKTDPSSTQLIKVTSETIINSPSLGSSFLNRNTDIAQKLLSYNGSTNPFNDIEHAVYQYNGKVTLPIVVDLFTQKGNLYPIFRVQTKNGPINYMGDTAIVSKDSFETWLSGATNESMLNQIRLKEPNIDKLIKK